ncbi:hypothetical protein AVEN_173272-1 [Araneus ventricosus]|uniref:Uncharacterized protein n=1 Tax=Araneus ventricosus TaxID=182803 RepID=A0A4Y2W1K0_ARAVE|nr:hypothetical protein AVEN_173272-1 [Araneus ventricosus]
MNHFQYNHNHKGATKACLNIRGHLRNSPLDVNIGTEGEVLMAINVHDSALQQEVRPINGIEVAQPHTIMIPTKQVRILLLIWRLHLHVFVVPVGGSHSRYNDEVEL